jgi:hypothetical protein
MNVERTAMFCGLLLLAQGQALACEERDLQPLLERFAVATSLPLDECEREIAAVGGDAFWRGECHRIEQSPDAAMLREHGHRMSIEYRELQTNADGATAVIVNLHGPDILAFNDALDRQKLCASAASGGDAERTRDPPETCGLWSWADIPVIDRYGAILLSCTNGRWGFVAPKESSRGETSKAGPASQPDST